MQVEVFDEEKMQLGEGPHWSTQLNALCWVDILNNKVVVKSQTSRIEFGDFNLPSSVISSSEATIEVVDATGVWELNVLTSQKTLIAPIPQGNPSNRSNESQRDPYGNLWIGRMNQNDSLRTGELLCINVSGEASIQIPDMGIPNTLVWDESRSRMYFADSADGAIYMVPVDNGVPNFSEKSIFSKLEDEYGDPDGSAIRANGNILNARWGAGRVIEFDPAGSIVNSIEIPAVNVTSCALNADESILYVTTADVDSPANDQLAGSTFAVQL
jgi:sugar lactone lactonase YvrE